ncbi:hypothetical protein V8C35DRAFT_277888 [Trichoderma chlorosporum]
MFPTGISLTETANIALNLHKLCISMKNAPKELTERALQVESYSAKILVQTQFLESVGDKLEPEHQQLSVRVLEETKLKLDIASKELAEFQALLEVGEEGGANTNTSKTKLVSSRAKFAMRKEAIDSAIAELHKLQSSTDLIWLLILKTAHDLIDRKIKEPSVIPKALQSEMLTLRSLLQDQQTTKTVFVSQRGLTDAEAITKLPFCVASLLTREKRLYIVDNVVSTSSSTSALSTVTDDVQTLAQKLREYKCSFGLLQCRGVVKNVPPGQQGGQMTMDLVFKMPLGFENPRSLRSTLLSSEKPPSLSILIRLGLELAKSVCHMHILNVVHKNIRPETILLFQEPSTKSLAPFLVGFEKFRKDGGHSSRLGSGDWKLNMYAHPKRYGINPKENYVMQHDIYSLGVCLLEIGLWESLISYKKPEDLPDLSDLLTMPLDNAIGQPSTPFKRQFLALARESLPARMGTRYSRVVETCLTCLDEGNDDFGDEWEFQDANGLLVGVRYIEKVITQLDAIQV